MHAAALASFHGGETKQRQLCAVGDKILVPASLQMRMVEWCHENLCHPGEDRTEDTIVQHFAWKGVRKTARQLCKTCDACQCMKKKKKKHGKPPPKTAEATPWDALCVDMIGPYKTARKRKPDLQSWAVTMIDPATGWFEIAEAPGTERADVAANLVEQQWSTRCPWPDKIVVDRGTEFMAEFNAMLTDECAFSATFSTERNPQSNATLERAHQTIGNMLRTFAVQNNDAIDEEDPWSGVLSAAAFAVRAAVHSTSRATPMQMVFGRDAMLNIRHLADWRYVRERKQERIVATNDAENSKRLAHGHKPGDQVLVKAAQKRKHGSDACLGPCTVERVHNDGTLRVDEGPFTDVCNVRNATPYRSNRQPLANVQSWGRVPCAQRTKAAVCRMTSHDGPMDGRWQKTCRRHM